jgi:two-component system, OmpR family, sensor histidine kinase KdpD
VDEAAVLAFADELELVDAPPGVLADRARRGELGPAEGDEEAVRNRYAPEALAAQREHAFSIVSEHADRRLETYRGDGSGASDHLPPVILACVDPEPGMEPLIRGAAAQAARLAGNFLAAAVVPPASSREREQVLAGYAALTARLGGQFATLHGSPAAELAAFADEHQVTEILLARGSAHRGGHHPVLRALAQRPDVADVHVLPAAEVGRTRTAGGSRRPAPDQPDGRGDQQH